MNPRPGTTHAFTLIEVLAVIAILAIIVTISVVGFRNFASFQQYNQAVSDVTFLLNQTRLDARSAVADASHGIKIDPTSLTRFVGDAYVFGDPDNETVDYSLITFTVDLSDGGDEIIFSKLTGLPSATGTVTVTGTRFTGSTTLEITGAGVVQ